MKDSVISASGLLDERGDKLNVIVQKADDLANYSDNFFTTARKVRRAECMKKVRLYIIIGVVLLLIIYVIIGLTCSWDFKC